MFLPFLARLPQAKLFIHKACNGCHGLPLLLGRLLLLESTATLPLLLRPLLLQRLQLLLTRPLVLQPQLLLLPFFSQKHFRHSCRMHLHSGRMHLTVAPSVQTVQTRRLPHDYMSSAATSADFSNSLSLFIKTLGNVTPQGSSFHLQLLDLVGLLASDGEGGRAAGHH